MKNAILCLILVAGCASNGIEMRPLARGTALVYLHGDIVPGVAEKIAHAVDDAFKSHRALTVEIDSPGGDADEGIAIYKALRAAKVPTACLVTGEAASAAFLVLEGCGSRRMTNTSRLMTHHPFGVIMQAPVIVTPERARSMYESLQKTADFYDRAISSRLGMSLEKYQEKVANGAVWEMNSDQAFAADAVDIVVDGTVVNTDPQ